MSYERRTQLTPTAILDGHAGRNQEWLRTWEDYVESLNSTEPGFPTTLSERLLERIADERNLDLAWEYLRRRGGPAPGMDGLRYGDWSLGERWDAWRVLSSAIKNGSYRPVAPKIVRRRKPGGGFREICVFNIVDRVAQRAVVQILQPILDPAFDSYSFGSRPGRGRLSAVAALEAMLLRSGRRVLVLVDFRRAFDSIPKSRLAEILRKRIPNFRVVDLLSRIVTTRPGKCGIPQGAPLSPLLMNLYADECVDRRWRRAHPRDPLIRYVDNNGLIADSVEGGQALYDDFAELIRPHGFALNETKQEAVQVLGRDSVEWLGFRLQWHADRLVCRLPETLEADLYESLMDCHRRPDAVRHANAVIRGVVEEAGPALEHLDTQSLYRRVSAVAAACEFREIVPLDVFRLRCIQSIRRWRGIRRAVHRAEGLSTSDSAPPQQNPLRKSLGRGKFEIYTDGCCLTPKGAGGWACVIRTADSPEPLEYSDGLRRTTNNRAELTAVVRGLQLTTAGSTVQITTDSRYVFAGLRERYRRWRRRGWRTSSGRPVLHRQLWQTLARLVEEREVKIHWVPGHSGHAENELADELAFRAAERLRNRIHRAQKKSGSDSLGSASK